MLAVGGRGVEAAREGLVCMGTFKGPRSGDGCEIDFWEGSSLLLPRRRCDALQCTDLSHLLVLEAKPWAGGRAATPEYDGARRAVQGGYTLRLPWRR